jgi:hypothetical protein
MCQNHRRRSVSNIVGVQLQLHFGTAELEALCWGWMQGGVAPSRQGVRGLNLRKFLKFGNKIMHSGAFWIEKYTRKNALWLQLQYAVSTQMTFPIGQRPISQCNTVRQYKRW